MTQPYLAEGTPPTHLLTLEEAEEQLQPYKALLDECIQKAWEAWDRDYKFKHHILDARARAVIVFNEIVFLAEQKFSGLPGVKLMRRGMTFLLYIGNDILIRFKKIRKNGKCSCIYTRQQALFAVQQISLPGMEEGTLLNAGYALDDLQTRIVRKSIVCQFANRVLWTIDLATGTNSAIEMIPVPRPGSPRPRWTKKTATEEKVKTKRKGA